MNEKIPPSNPAPAPITKSERKDDTVQTYFSESPEHDGWSEIRRRVTPPPPEPKR